MVIRYMPADMTDLEAPVYQSKTHAASLSDSGGHQCAHLFVRAPNS